MLFGTLKQSCTGLRETWTFVEPIGYVGSTDYGDDVFEDLVPKMIFTPW
jgi:hypothetical protein